MKTLIAALLCGAAAPAQFTGLWWRFVEDHATGFCMCPTSGGYGEFDGPNMWFPTPEYWAQGTATVAWHYFDPSAPVMLMLSANPPLLPPPIPCLAVAPDSVLIGAADISGKVIMSWPVPTFIPGLPTGQTIIGCGQVAEFDASQPIITAFCSSYVFTIVAQN